ncbi:putative PAS fold protein, partial [Streptomyces himastatinicus ATCC 53653]
MTRPDTPPHGQPVRSDDLIDEASTARATVDERGIVTQWNEGAEGLLGYRPEEIVGRSAAGLLADRTNPLSVAETLRALNPPDRFRGRVALLHRDGSRVTAGLLAHRVTASGDTTEWLVVSPLPRPERPLADEELLKRCFAQGPCTMAVYDTDLRLRWANQDMERVLGLTQEEIRGLRVPEISPGPEAEETEERMLRVLETGEEQHIELFLRMPGHDRPVAWSTSLAPLTDGDGRVAAVMLSAHDRTPQHTTRQRLLLLNEASVRIGSTLDLDRTAQE